MPPTAGLPQYQPPVPQSRPVSFYIAIFLGLLLFVSGALNVILLLVSLVGAAGSLPTTVAEEDDLYFRVVTVGGNPAAPTKLLRVPIQGAISELGSPLLGTAGGTVSQVRRALALADRKTDIAGVLLDINSPGGGVTDSDEIHRLLRQFKADNPDKPLLALFGDMSASGGYYIAAACDHIMARHTTITGSIGVIMSGLNYGKGLADIGVHEVVLKSERTPFKDILSPTRPMTEEERRHAAHHRRRDARSLHRHRRPGASEARPQGGGAARQRHDLLGSAGAEQRPRRPDRFDRGRLRVAADGGRGSRTSRSSSSAGCRR